MSLRVWYLILEFTLCWGVDLPQAIKRQFGHFDYWNRLKVAPDYRQEARKRENGHRCGQRREKKEKNKDDSPLQTTPFAEKGYKGRQ